VEDEYTELDAAHDQIEDLQAALVVANMGSTDSEEAAQAANLIADLRAHIKTLEATLKAVTISRDTFQNQVAEMQRQINRQRREIDRATGTRTA
jgi:chromosome segregation ATPase